MCEKETHMGSHHPGKEQNLASLPAPHTAPNHKGNHRPDFHGKPLYSSLNISSTRCRSLNTMV